jgi:hypothetical protein
VSRLEGVVSIHDVAPETLSRVGELVELVRPLAGTRVSLLVVPGRAWRSEQLARLRGWAREGFEVAGHGWVHRGRPRTLYHRLHGLVISRDQAEHLSRSRGELRALVARGFEWFSSVDLPEPRLYVPPAWALGALTADDLEVLPYRWYELQTGYTLARRRRHLVAPLMGFEADTRLRQSVLRVSNRLNAGVGRVLARPVRIGLHPHDLHLRLATDVREALDRCGTFLTTEEAVARLGGEGEPGAATAGSATSGAAATRAAKRPPSPQSTPGRASSKPDSARLRASER